MANLSFTTSGATPALDSYFTPKSLPIGGTQTTTPVGNALNTAQRPSYTPPPSIPQPSTAVKSTTINNPDGSSHVTTYHTPDTGGSTGSGNSTGGSSSSSTGNSTPGLFQQTATNLADTSKTGSATAPGYIAQTAGYGAGNIPIGQNGNDITQKYNGLINPLLKNTIGEEIGNRTSGGTVSVGEGNAAAAAAAGGALIQGLTNQENQELAGNAQGLTAQQQAATAANEAAGQAQTGQGLVQSGLTSAGGLAQPQLGSIGQVPFSPTEGSQGSPLGAPGGTAADAAKVAGQFQGAQAAAAAGGQTQAQNTIASGTATTGANASGLADSIKQETALNTAAANATALATQVQTAMTNSGLNLTNSTDANTAINNLQSRLGSAAYTQLNIAVNDARNAYATILTATGSTPTDADAKANQNINPNMSPNQILGAIDQLNQGVNAKQKNQHQQTQQYQAQLNGSGEGGSSSSASGSWAWNP